MPSLQDIPDKAAVVGANQIIRKASALQKDSLIKVLGCRQKIDGSEENQVL